mgnify:CR=1 FL=1
MDAWGDPFATAERGFDWRVLEQQYPFVVCILEYGNEFKGIVLVKYG